MNTSSTFGWFTKIGKFFVSSVVLSVFLPVFFIPLMFIDGWVVTKMWRWFIVPIFVHAPILHLGTAVGLLLVVRHFGVNRAPKDNRKFHEVCFQAAVGPLVVLGLAWIIKTWFLAL